MISFTLAIAFSLSALGGGVDRIALPCDTPSMTAGVETLPIATQDSSIVVVSTERRAMCPDGSFHVTVRNRSSAKRDVKLCIMKGTGKWDCKESMGVGAGRTWSYWICNASGNYWFTSRDSESKDPMADPPTG